jgi:hypothetical protein
MRNLAPALETALETGVREPDYQLLAFDPALDGYSAIIAGTYTQTPLDLTPYCADLSWTPAQLTFSLVDEDGSFNGDTGQYRKYLKDGAIIRLKEGDTRVSANYWPWTFTGAIKGQSGWSKGPRPQTLQARVTAFSRDNTQAFKRRQITSKQYTAGTDLGVVFHDLAESFLGLTDDENLVPINLGRSLLHKTNQLVQVAPWDGLTALLEVVSLVPRFNGEGRLTYFDKNLARAPNRELPDYITVHRLEQMPRTQDVINKVVVVFLDSELSEIEGTMQVLGSASITTGFFTFEERIPCYWSTDRKQRAKSTWMKIIKSVNANLLPVGEESYAEKDIYHGEIRIEIYIWVPMLATVLLADYVAATMLLPDTVVVPLGGTGYTIPWGRAAQAADLIGILVIMMSLGSAQYEIWGVPYDLVYQEQESIAVEDGLSYWEENELEIKNDFIGSFDQADAVAVTELIFQKSMGELRRLVLDDDLALEPGDIVQVPDGRRIFIQNMNKQVRRGELPVLTVDGFKVLTA